jgi:hypothetical protein
MMVHLGVQRSLGKRLFKAVQKALGIESCLRIKVSCDDARDQGLKGGSSS